MSHHKDKGRLSPFVPIFRHTIKTPAWQALSVGARATFLELKSNYNSKAQNYVYLSSRKGAKKLGVCKDTARKWLHELEHYGFIVEVQSALLAATGVGRAAHYRLTDSPFAGKPATYDFQNWNGVLYDSKKQNPVRKNRTPCPKKSDTKAANAARKRNKRPKISDIRNEAACPKKSDITSFNHSLDLPVSPLEWSTPTVAEMAYTPSLRGLYAGEMAKAAGVAA